MLKRVYYLLGVEMHFCTIKTGKTQYQFKTTITDGNHNVDANADNYYNGGSGSSGTTYAIATFTSSDMTGNVYRFNHALGKHITLDVYDNNADIVTPTSVTYVDANNVDIDLTGLTPITGTWTVVGV